MDSPSSPFAAVLVLAGGESRRLGRDKARLEFAGEPLLARVVRRLAPLAPTGEVLVVARPGQPLPPVPARRIDDTRPGEGPLAGLAVGLAEVARRAGGEAPVAVSACDVPFADPVLFRILLEALGDADVAVPRHAERLHVLQAVWRARLATDCERALAGGERRVRSVVEAAAHAIVDPTGLPVGIDPARALLNVNDSDDLARARARETGPSSASEG